MKTVMTRKEALETTFRLAEMCSNNTNMTYVVPELDPYNGSENCKMIREGVSQTLLDGGYEMMAERFLEAAEEIPSVMPLIILAAGFVNIEPAKKKRQADESMTIPERIGHPVIEILNGHLIGEDGQPKITFRVGSTYYPTRLDAIHASRELAPMHAPIIAMIENPNVRKYTVNVEGTRVFDDLPNAVLYAAQVHDKLTPEESMHMDQMLG